MTPEFSRIVPLIQLGFEPFRQQIAADGTERAALARRFDLVSLDRLEATIELQQESGGTYLLRAEFAANFAQICTITLDPVPGNIRESFSLRYGPPEAEPGEAGEEEPAFEPLAGEAIDVGEAVAQEFSLALPQFPRAPGAGIEARPEPAPEDGPFAALAKLTRREPR